MKNKCSSDDSVIYPVFYADCNYGGEKYVLKDNYEDMDLSNYLSIYIPERHSLTISNYDNGKVTNEYELVSSMTCKGALSTLMKNYKPG